VLKQRNDILDIMRERLPGKSLRFVKHIETGANSTHRWVDASHSVPCSGDLSTEPWPTPPVLEPLESRDENYRGRFNFHTAWLIDRDSNDSICFEVHLEVTGDGRHHRASD
jgi:hypothetical protein